MAEQPEQIYSGSGRLISGSLTEKNKTDHKGNPLPEDKHHFFFAVAVPKTDPAVQGVLGKLFQIAQAGYANAPHVMQRINMGLQPGSGFAWKVDDGDSMKPDEKTGQMVERGEHWKGCYVFKFSTLYPVGACNMQGQEINPADIKRGDYLDVCFTSQVNGSLDHTAGIYLNPRAVMLVGYGEEIKTGVSATQAFAGRQHALPPGASTVPTSAGATPPPAHMTGGGQPAGNPGAPAPGQTAPGGMPNGMPAGAPGQQTVSPTDPAVAGVQPHNGILHGPQGQAPGAPAGTPGEAYHAPNNPATVSPSNGGGMPGT